MFLFLNSRRKNFYFLKVIIIIITQLTIANFVNIEKFEFFEKVNEFLKHLKNVISLKILTIRLFIRR